MQICLRKYRFKIHIQYISRIGLISHMEFFMAKHKQRLSKAFKTDVNKISTFVILKHSQVLYEYAQEGKISLFPNTKV